MLDDFNAELLRQLRTMFRARPFSKAVPFQKAISDTVTGDLWTPINAYFEVGAVLIRADTAGIDVLIADTDVSNPFMFLMPPTTIYQLVSLLPNGYRSIAYSGAKMVANASAAVTIKGIVYGWEVNNNGVYR